MSNLNEELKNLSPEMFEPAQDSGLVDREKLLHLL